ncbi:MAG: hypothetical protein ORN51_06115 [Akkermansiaceae bacterium]|nr:hypothetical protein [Akkermansiaceae bacterium]
MHEHSCGLHGKYLHELVLNLDESRSVLAETMRLSLAFTVQVDCRANGLIA